MSQRRSPTVHLGTADPGVNDDLSVRCYPGDLWVRRSTGGAWVLTDDADGAAVWLAVGGGGGGGGGAPTGASYVVLSLDATLTAERRLQVGTGLSLTDGGAGGDVTIAPALDLAALEGLASTGIAVRTGVSTWTTRTLTSSSTQISVTNGDGVAGAPTLTLDAGLVSLAGIDTAADLLPYTTAANTWTAANLTAFGRSLLDDADATAGRATLAAAPAAGPYVTTSSSAELTAETVLTAGSLISLGGAATIGVTFAATQRVAGRTTAGAGAGEEVSASGVLDWIGSTRGSVLYRGAGGWSALTPGTATHVLTSNGPGADPSWAAAPGGGSVTIGSSTATFATGDTWVRKTITDVSVSGTSKILVGVQSPAYTDDAADLGWAYSAQVVLRAAGSFDVVVHAVPVWGADSSPEGPGTTVTIYYVLG